MTNTLFAIGVSDDGINVCGECFRALERDKVPPANLVRLDQSPWPADEEGPLPVPTYQEATVLGAWRVLRSVMILGGGEHVVLSAHGVLMDTS